MLVRDRDVQLTHLLVAYPSAALALGERLAVGIGGLQEAQRAVADRTEDRASRVRLADLAPQPPAI
jgi:hypothetical protein